MALQNTNPFVLPGLGQEGDASQNPLMASMEMMRQAWQGLAGQSGLGPAAMSVPMSLEDMDRRIADLHTVENWLRMNLAMLSSTIQGLEVQRATVATLQSFMAGAAPQPSSGQTGPGAPAGAKAGAGRVDGGQKSSGAKAQGASNSPAGPQGLEPDAAGAQAATRDWWNMLQKQFDTLAAVTAATMHGAEAIKAMAESGADPDAAGGRKAPRTPRKAPGARKGAAKAAPRKRAGPGSRT